MRLGTTSFDPNARTAILQEQVQKMRMADAELRSEARHIQAQATAAGQTVTTQLTYGRGPNGQSYATSITITRTATVAVGESLAPQGMNRPILPQTMEAISPARMPFTPSDMAEGFDAGMREAGRAIAEGLVLNELQHADSGVRNHEGLHFRTAGGLATGLPKLEYIQGPDGQYYAVAGQVNVQTGATFDPEKASRDAATYARAAIAPGDASAQDISAARDAHAHAADTYGKAQASRAVPSSSVVA